MIVFVDFSAAADLEPGTSCYVFGSKVKRPGHRVKGQNQFLSISRADVCVNGVHL